MRQTQIDKEALAQVVSQAVLGDGFRRATFAGALRGGVPWPWRRVVVRPVLLRGSPHLQFSYFDQKKDVSRNFAASEAAGPLAEVIAAGYSGIHLSAGGEEIDVQTTKKGKILIGRRKADATAASPQEQHNRVKDVPLPEGTADRVLEVMGVMTADGLVRPSMRGKYTQINKFLEHLEQAVEDAGLRGLGRELRVLDCGCGSSYLTLAAHHYLNDVLGVPARVLGVDVNEELIRKSVERSERLGAERLDFACARIGALDAQPDVVLALHACDTATDDAIAQAVRSGAAALLSAPCCHKDLNGRLRAEGPAEALRPLLRHGLLRQRTADLVTDAFRSLALRVMGYRTEVAEFVGGEHTARNLLIRAVRGPAAGELSFVREYREMCRFWGVTPYVESALGEAFTGLLARAEA
jgi:SAM-dependent methyltransferase